jgi:hypothetical protein
MTIAMHVTDIDPDIFIPPVEHFCIEWDEAKLGAAPTLDFPEPDLEAMEVEIEITSKPVMSREGSVVRYSFDGRLRSK